MNLFQINSGVHKDVLEQAIRDVYRYVNFIKKAIDFLKEETLSIPIASTIVGTETRYSPEEPQNRKQERAIKALFEEATKQVFDQKKEFDSRNGIEIIEQNEQENYFTTRKPIQGSEVYLKPDTYQLEQQEKALKNLIHNPLKEHQPLLELFGYPDSNFWWQRYNPQNLDWHILADDNKDGVDEQREFVKKALQTKDFALLEGPPGSGKTTTIIELILQLTKEGKRVLLCSATHAAIDNVIERVKERYKDICDKYIVPIRISRSPKAVKENVRPYLLQNVVETYKKDTLHFLKQNQHLESQQYLLKNIEEYDQYIDQIILDSANLVAGTMVGILQHPDIRNNKQGASFDVLIVDEASKVTFADFIVPALHAKKWVLVGDVKQLSPYVEDDYVAENIASLLSEKEQEILARQFELKNKLSNTRYKDCLKVYFTPDADQEYEILQDGWSKDMCMTIVDEHWEANEENVGKLNAYDVVVAQDSPKVRQRIAENLYVKSIFFNEMPKGITQNYRQDYFRKNEKEPNYFFEKAKNQDTWANMVASRLSQSFSFRNTSGEFAYIDNELAYLLTAEIQKNVNEIKRLVFPSILELLQNGVGKGEGQRSAKVISDGFDVAYKESRFVSLSYQHRMEDAIAQTSREHFYENNLQTANTVLAGRGWQYKAHEAPVKWVHNTDSTGIGGGKIINPTEVNDMMRELEEFLDWAKNNPKPNGEKYEVAILTFYLNQEHELRKRLRKLTVSGAFAKFYKDNTNIFLYTVDKFQGQEADIVLLGFTKFTRSAHYNSPNRLNVALTRARHKLILFGNRKWLAQKAKLNALQELATKFGSHLTY